jgi:class 3 adenylate cyclase
MVGVPIFMDMHDDLGDVTEDDIKAAHQRDLDLQGKHGVQFLTYWFNSPGGHAFCLVDAPSREAAIACHKESHGLVPHKMIEVSRPTVSQFIGDWEQYTPNGARVDGPGSDVDTGLRAIMFTDLEGSTDISSRLGDHRVLEILRRHDEVVRQALSDKGGREVKHTGDGILASFTYVSRAIDCALQVQRTFAARSNEEGATATGLRIGISAGEPVAESNDLFGAAVSMAARICAHASPGQVLVSSAVRDLSIGKRFTFVDQGPIALKGFDEPVRLFEVPPSEG